MENSPLPLLSSSPSLSFIPAQAQPRYPGPGRNPSHRAAHPAFPRAGPASSRSLSSLSLCVRQTAGVPPLSLCLSAKRGPCPAATTTPHVSRVFILPCSTGLRPTEIHRRILFSPGSPAWSASRAHSCKVQRTLPLAASACSRRIFALAPLRCRRLDLAVKTKSPPLL